MTLKKLRQILKTLGDDTRLRIIYLLNIRELTVSDICLVLKINQSAASKHLVRLRLMKIVNDRREGNFIYYSLRENIDTKTICKFLFSEFKEIPALGKDRKNLSKIEV